MIKKEKKENIKSEKNHEEDDEFKSILEEFRKWSKEIVWLQKVENLLKMI